MTTGATGWYHWEGEELLLRLRVQPRASRDEFIAPHEDYYRVRITAPPLENRANQHLIRFLASSFGVSRSRVTLESGQKVRNKLFRIVAPSSFPIPVKE
jgi:uncharacterized protein (TIGR00251 family)